MRTIFLRPLVVLIMGLLFSPHTCLAAEPVPSEGKVPRRIATINSENEYSTWETLPEFARRELLPRGYQVSTVAARCSGGEMKPREVCRPVEGSIAVRGVAARQAAVNRIISPKCCAASLGPCSKAHEGPAIPISGFHSRFVQSVEAAAIRTIDGYLVAVADQPGRHADIAPGRRTGITGHRPRSAGCRADLFRP